MTVEATIYIAGVLYHKVSIHFIHWPLLLLQLLCVPVATNFRHLICLMHHMTIKLDQISNNFVMFHMQNNCYMSDLEMYPSTSLFPNHCNHAFPFSHGIYIASTTQPGI